MKRFKIFLGFYARIRWLMTVILTLSVSLFVVFNGTAAAIQASQYGTPPAPISYTDNIGSNPAPVQIEYSATAGPWMKSFTNSNPMTVPCDNGPCYTTLTFISEIVQVSGSSSWSGWYEEILTTNWIFLNSGGNLISIIVNGNPLNIPVSVAADGKSFQLNFDPIAPGAICSINFPLSYTGTPPLFTFPSFELKSYPIASTADVPEPTTLIFLGLGLVGLAGVRRFRK